MYVKDVTNADVFKYADEDLKQLMRIGIIRAVREFSKKVS